MQRPIRSARRGRPPKEKGDDSEKWCEQSGVTLVHVATAAIARVAARGGWLCRGPAAAACGDEREGVRARPACCRVLGQ